MEQDVVGNWKFHVSPIMYVAVNLTKAISVSNSLWSFEQKTIS